MSDFKFIASANVDTASATSLTSAIAIPGNFSHFAIEVPALMLNTATGNIRVLGGRSLTGTFQPIVYSNNPSTTTTGNAFAGEVAYTGVISGTWMINEA